METKSVFWHLNFAEVSLIWLRKMSHNWRNYSKKLKLSDAKNTNKTGAFFSTKKLSETVEFWCGDWEQSESMPLASTSSVESQFTHIAESET